ncbi:MAG TPA: hypothetical protein VM076_18320 [Gemmatimonadaceae bacterium]|nr:hypothetical protein [Gemmatimonadaceae bacterium]
MKRTVALVIASALGLAPNAAQAQRWVDASGTRFTSTNAPLRPAALAVAEPQSQAPAVPTLEGAPAGGGRARHTLVGALVGATAGAVVALAVTHQGSVTDHSEDGIAYVFFVPIGALVGALVGAVLPADGPQLHTVAPERRDVGLATIPRS